MTWDELLQEKVQDWGYEQKEDSGYEYTVYLERDGGDGYMDELDESFDNLDDALDFRDEKIAEGWEVRYIKRYDSTTYDYEGVEIKV